MVSLKRLSASPTLFNCQRSWRAFQPTDHAFGGSSHKSAGIIKFKKVIEDSDKLVIIADMDELSNPYAPGAGRQPPEFAGREALINGATINIKRILLGRSANSVILLGLRGVGKTVLLNRMHEIAVDNGCKTIRIEAPEDGKLPELLAPELRRVLHSLDLKTAAGHKLRQAMAVLRNFIGTFKISTSEIDLSIEPAPGLADTGKLQQDVPALLVAASEAAAEKKTAICLFIDELQYLSRDELAAIIVACHVISQRGLPFYFVGAGLPQIAALAGEAKSYAERLFSLYPIGQLDEVSASAALVKPAKQEGANFSEEAVKTILDLTERYPYFIQEWGYHVWNIAKSNLISLNDVEQATPLAIARLDESFFRFRFERLTLLEQKYVRAMAELGRGPYRTGDIAQKLGIEASAIAPTRAILIKKGMIWSQKHGETAFTVPMFESFIIRQMPNLETHTPKPKRRKS
jgi:hypothetical protein